MANSFFCIAIWIIWHNLLFQKIIGESDLVEKYIYDFSLDYENLCYGFAKGEISEGKFMSSFVAHKLEVEKLIENCKSAENEELVVLTDYANLMIVHFSKVFDKFYSSTSKQSVCYEFFVSFVLVYVDLCDNLQ